MKSHTSYPDSDLILRHIQDGIVLLDPQGTIRYANEAFHQIVGRVGADLIGKHISEIFDENVLRQLASTTLESLTEGTRVHFNVEIPNENGKKGAYCFFASPVRDDTGTTIGLLENFRGMDGLRTMILQLEEVNQAIQHEKDKAERIVDSIADGIFTVDQDLIIRSFSSKMEQLTGIPAGKAIGSRCPEVLRGTKCETDCPLRWSFSHSATVERCREIFRVTHRRQIPVSITTAFLQDEKGATSGLIGVVRDHTELERLRGELHEKYSYQNLIGRSNSMQRIFDVIQTVAETDATVLIHGETGTGKEMVAQAIHHRSPRKDAPFVMLNCAALNDNLLESELFGHVRGAFTGAIADKPGRFELAEGGTLFLDEIGDTTPALQS
ncbi:MAG TPA: sigma 54-interacting transcriptional regulator, partial [Acidobacteriota bacterium]|nr:sigma 54-interacting transcriptional regulator [Acidobacteriota bacterium]